MAVVTVTPADSAAASSARYRLTPGERTTTSTEDQSTVPATGRADRHPGPPPPGRPPRPGGRRSGAASTPRSAASPARARPSAPIPQTATRRASAASSVNRSRDVTVPPTAGRRPPAATSGSGKASSERAARSPSTSPAPTSAPATGARVVTTTESRQPGRSASSRRAAADSRRSPTHSNGLSTSLMRAANPSTWAGIGEHVRPDDGGQLVRRQERRQHQPDEPALGTLPAPAVVASRPAGGMPSYSCRTPRGSGPSRAKARAMASSEYGRRADP